MFINVYTLARLISFPHRLVLSVYCDSLATVAILHFAFVYIT